MALSFALALLLAAPDSPELPIPERDWPRLRVELQRLCVGLEILDERELKYVLVERGNFENDLNLLRRRYQDLADAPPLADAARFPDREQVGEYLVFNRSYKRWLEARQPIEVDRDAAIREALRETDRLYCVFDNVRDAGCAFYYSSVKRAALKRLREQLGEAYYTGELPPFVPLWRFVVVP
jgi:hypothetical protein